jgi:Protein of unknown function (DUF2950)
MNRTIFEFGRASRGFRLALAAGMLVLASGASAQKSYPTPDAAVNAFIDGVSRNDYDQVGVVLGPNWKKFVPTETVDGEDVTRFLEAWSKSHRVVMAGDAKAFLEVGTHGWTMPIPIEKTSSGWRFETSHTPDELRTRRIGRNELDVIQVVLALTDAQQDYAANDRDRDGVKQYAQKILSSPGKHDGLYWPTVPGEAPSPLGPIAANPSRSDAYHGYRYRILTAQGKDAPGGAMSYIAKGRMTGGYAVVAWPAKYGDTGVMSFIVAKDGIVYQKNLGAQTDKVAAAMTTYNPDSSWTKVEPTK